PAGTSGAFADLGRTGAPIKVLGAGGLEHHVQDTVKLKAALDLGDVAQLSYVIALWHDDTHGTAETYLANAANQPVYTGAFSSNVYRRDSLHWSHVLNLQGGAPRLDWQVVGTVYDYARDTQRSPTGLLPAAFAGGAGNVQRMDGTGWVTLDTKAAWHADGGDTNVLSFGAHFDRYRLESDRYTTPDWTSPQQDALNQASRGKTRIVALWAQDAVKFTPALTLMLGARYEWWRAWNGLNFSTVPPLNVTQPERRAEGFSPKATLDWRPAAGWRAKASFGQAVRFPTVGELYQAITTGPTLTSPDPNLAPERARSEEVAIEHDDGHGTVRLSLFNEVVTHALISQSGTLPGLAGTFSFVQNVDRTRARGVELAIDRRDVVPTVDVSANVTYADAVTSKDTAFPAAVGKLLPSVPHWKANAVVTWRPAPQLSLTAAARYASRMYATIDNSDPVGNTYTGFYKYLVIDLRALFKVNDHFEFALGVDNLTNDKYFLFHPFPQRSLTAQVNWKL
ncbi:MAG: TonB-dependent receptor, partial [Novosphingobium sp.]|nr:TonB-dependent receptor [Novosphingobium sp.]